MYVERYMYMQIKKTKTNFSMFPLKKKRKKKGQKEEKKASSENNNNPQRCTLE